MDSSIKEKEQIIQYLEKANAENIDRIKNIENLLLEKDKEIHALKNKKSKLKEKKVPQSFFKDIVYAFELLKREGLKSFVYRTYWYIRGKRLVDDIHKKKGSEYVLHKNQN